VATAPLRQLSIGEILDVAINIAWKKAGILVPAVAIVVVPTQLLSTLVDASNAVTTTTDPATGQQVTHGSELGATVSIITILLSALAVALATGACFKAVRDTYLGEQASARGSLAYALRRLHSLLWVSFLGWLVPVLGLFLLIVPGVWLWASFGVAVPVLMAEGIKGTGALGRSRELVRGRWWGTFAVMLLGFILTFIAEGLISGGMSALVFSGGSTERAIGDGIGSMVAALITTPFTAAFLTVLYFDLRVRNEGLDLEQQAERMAPPGLEALEQ
jgi:hypothetical protein